MRTPPVVLLLLAAGCTKPAPVTAPAPVSPGGQASRAPAPAEVTCGDAGVLLRGSVDDQKQAGPAKEAAIARTCKLERWPADVLRCVGEQPRARPCLDRLTEDQRTAYHDALVAWNDSYPEEELEETDGGGVDGLIGGDHYIDCSDAIADAAGFAPAVTLTGDSRDYVLELRKAALLELCEDWDMARRACFHDVALVGGASSAPEIDRCRARLEPAHARAVTDRLAAIDALGAKIAGLKKTAASHDCKKVVAAHYADAAWKGKLDAVKGAERTRAIAESRAKMAKACTEDRWPANMRACIVAGGAEACFTAVSSSSWGFPAIGVIVKTGIPECDAYAETMKAVDACTAMPQSQRDTVKRSWGYLSASWTNATPDRRVAIAASCKAVDEAVRRAVSSAGCKI
jgi:hypothetical protein